MSQPATVPAAPKTGSWWTWIVCVDAALVLVTGVNRYLPALPGWEALAGEGGWRILEPFNLSREHGPAAWWSGMSLLAAGLLCFEQASVRPSPARPAFRALGGFLTLLSLDEICSIHERMGGIREWAPWITVAALAVGAALAVLWKDPANRRFVVRMVAGLGVLSSVILLEVLERRVELPHGLLGPRAALEESLELLGELLLLAALVPLRPSARRRSRRAAIPAPGGSSLGAFLLAVVLVHAGLVLQWGGATMDARIGNVDAWAPATLWFVAVCRLTWSSGWSGAGVLCLAGSVDAVFRLPRYLPEFAPSLGAALGPSWWEGPGHLGVLAVLLALALWMTCRRRVTRCSLAVLLAAGVLVLLGNLAAPRVASLLALAPGLAALWVTKSGGTGPRPVSNSLSS